MPKLTKINKCKLCEYWKKVSGKWHDDLCDPLFVIVFNVFEYSGSFGGYEAVVCGEKMFHFFGINPTTARKLSDLF